MKYNNYLIQILTLILGVFAAVVTISSVYKACQLTGSCDIQYAPAVLLKQGYDPYATYIQALSNGQVSQIFPQYQYPNYPILGLSLLVPLASLPIIYAKFLWAIINVILALTLCWRLCTFLNLKISNKFVCIGMCLFMISPSIRGTIGNGQIGILAFLMFIIAFEQAPQRPWLAGVCLAIAYIKYNITLPLSLIFLCYPYGWIVLFAGCIHFLIIGLWAYVLQVCYADILLGPWVVSKTATYLYGYADLWGILRVACVPSWVLALMTCFLMLSISVWILRNRTTMPVTLLFCALTFFSMLIPYHSLCDSFVLIIPALFAYIAISQKHESVVSWPGLYLAVIAKAWFWDRLFYCWDNAYQINQLSYTLYLFNQTSTILLLWLCFFVSILNLIKHSQLQLFTDLK